MDRGPFFVESIARDDFSLEINFCVSLILNCYCLIFPLFLYLFFTNATNFVDSKNQLIEVNYRHKFHKNSKTLKIIFLSLL